MPSPQVRQTLEDVDARRTAIAVERAAARVVAASMAGGGFVLLCGALLACFLYAAALAGACFLLGAELSGPRRPCSLFVGLIWDNYVQQKMNVVAAPR